MARSTASIMQGPRGHRMAGDKGKTEFLPTEAAARAAYAKLTKPKAKPKAKDGE